MKTKVSTPWGMSQQQTVIADGITKHYCASHGGFHLSPEREAFLQGKFRFPTWASGPWYEEDCDAVAVVIAFPLAFLIDRIPDAVEYVKNLHKNEMNEGQADGKWGRVQKHIEQDLMLHEILHDAKTASTH